MKMYLEKAVAAYGENIKDWIKALATRCDELSSQARAGAEIGYSAAAVSTLLSGKYKATTEKIEQAVRARLMAETVDCPYYGDMDLADCLEWRALAKAPFRSISSLHTEMRGLCGRCPKNGGDHAQS